MNDIHPVASAGFSSDGRRYESGRPGYPAEAAGWLIDRLGIRPGATVVDVGAGTGKLTRDLTPSGARVIAVEPLAEMAALLAETAPAAEVVAAPAEELPFADGSIDAITSAQAFHWFDADRAWDEFHRVLAPGGGVGLVWNARDRTVPWLDAVWSIMDEVEKNAPWRDHDEPGQPPGAGFGAMEAMTFWHEVDVTHDAMLDRVASVSHVAVLPAAERRQVLDLVAAALPPEDLLRVRYRVDCYATYRH